MVTNEELARHIVQPHGDGRHLEPPLEVLLTWPREILEAQHERMREFGPCPSFRTQIRTKSA